MIGCRDNELQGLKDGLHQMIPKDLLDSLEAEVGGKEILIHFFFTYLMFYLSVHKFVENNFFNALIMIFQP